MKIGIPREPVPGEKRVMVTPETAKVLVDDGNELFVQFGAGRRVGHSDEDYYNAGATLVEYAKTLYERVDGGMIIKLKAPTADEFNIMQSGILFAMFHSAQNPAHVVAAGRNRQVAVEMESVYDDKGERIINQTAITGKAGVMFATRYSDKMPEDMRAVVMGSGRVSTGAIEQCAKLGIGVTTLRRDRDYRPEAISGYLSDCDILINGIAWSNEAMERARKEGVYLITREQIREAPSGLFVLDLSVDFPNPIQTCRPSSLSDPVYVEEGKRHASIYGYPGLWPRSSTRIYASQVLPLARLIAQNNGLQGISERGELGRSIARGIRDPEQMRWKSLESITSS